MSISIRFTSRIPCICPWKFHGIAVQILHVSVPEIDLISSYYLSLIIGFPSEMTSGCYLLWFNESNLSQKYFLSISIRFTSLIPCICPWKVRGIAAQILHASVPEISESILPDFIWFVSRLLFIPYYVFPLDKRSGCYICFLIHRIEFTSEILYYFIIFFSLEIRSGCYILDVLLSIKSKFSQKYFLSISIRFSLRIPCICPWQVNGIAAQILHMSFPEMFESILPEFFCLVLSSPDVPS